MATKTYGKAKTDHQAVRVSNAHDNKPTTDYIVFDAVDPATTTITDEYHIFMKFDSRYYVSNVAVGAVISREKTGGTGAIAAIADDTNIFDVVVLENYKQGKTIVTAVADKDKDNFVVSTTEARIANGASTAIAASAATVKTKVESFSPINLDQTVSYVPDSHHQTDEVETYALAIKLKSGLVAANTKITNIQFRVAVSRGRTQE